MKKLHSTLLRNAFTMLELIMVIVILGIVSSIGSSVIANIYENYILQKATHNASLKTELAAQQIANLLSYRIPGTTIAREPDLSTTVLVTDPTLGSDNTHTLLEWIAADNDGFSAALLPAWNGFCDLDASDQDNIRTPGSNLTLAHTIISNLSNSKVDLNNANNPAIFFRSINYSKDSAASITVPYMILSDGIYNACMGVVSSDRTCISSVKKSDSQTLNFVKEGDATHKVITEHYKLAWTAYSIYQAPNANGLFDLKLCYNYQPWEGDSEQLGANGSCPGTQSTIITNVSVFKFAESGNTFRFKVCAQENIGEDYNISICKEKAIIL